MASKRRGGSGSFRPPEVRGTLGTLLRSAIQQAGGVKDALTRGAQQGRSKIEELRADRRRDEALSQLGELVLDLIRRGEIDVAELPEARDVIRTLDELDAEDQETDVTSTQPFNRGRFDDRGAAPSPTSRADDGTVGSGAKSAQPRTGTTPQRVWRPAAEPSESEAPARPGVVPTLPKDPHRKGGISFEDDDLGDYMHPDDVPPKGSSDPES